MNSLRKFIVERRILFGSLLLFMLVILGVWPLVKLESVQGYSQATFDKDDKLISLTLTKDDKYRLFVPLENISKSVITSTLVYEDRHFFSHLGVNPVSILRGAFHSLFNPKKLHGGSTLTMQLVRLTYQINTRTLSGKLKQMVLASFLELKYSKSQILETYLNVAPYGANIEGVGAASLIYFNKDISKIKVEDAVTLAVLPQNPSRRWKESGRKDLDSSRDRLVRSIASIQGGSLIHPHNFVGTPSQVPSVAPHFSNRIAELYPGRSEYHSSLDSEMQMESQRVLNEALLYYSSFGIKNTTLIVAELPNMLIRTYIGSANYLDSNISGFVNGLSSKRSPGSLLKPFIYALAMDQGKILPETMLQDLPIRLSAYKPENFERNYLGPIPASQALIRSRNIPALEVFRKLSKGSFYDLLKQSGVSELKREDHYGIALVLGGLGLTSEELVGLYGILGNNGVSRGLHFFNKDIPTKEDRIISPEASFITKEILSRNPIPNTSSLKEDIPWKTGTSYGSKDAWSAGIVGKYVVVIWFGNFNSMPNANLVGRDVAGPVFFYVAESLKRLGAGNLENSPKDLNLKEVDVCAVTGALPNPNCSNHIKSWFIRGVSPIDKCDLHQKILIDLTDNLRVCPGQKIEGAQERVYEVWDSGMQELFKNVGLKRNLPPEFKPICKLRDSGTTQKIRIISPEEHLEYFIEPHRPLEMEFLASVSGEAKSVSWFVDDEMVGQEEGTKSLIWKAKSGKFNIRAVDNLGNSDVKVIKITTLTE